MSSVIITGAFSNNCPPYQGLAKWQIKSLNRMIDYCDHIGADLFVVDNSTGFTNYYNEIRKYGRFLPCGWATGTLCSVWGFSHLYHKYESLFWIDLDIVVNNNYNILEIMSNDFCIQNSLIDIEDVDKLYHTHKKKAFFNKEFIQVSNKQIYNVAAGLIKINNNIAKALNDFWFKEINYKDVVEYFLKKQTESNRIDFACDECVYEAFINSRNMSPSNIDINSFVINFHELILEQQEQLINHKTDKFVHFASNNKKYIPDFLKEK
jgi:hypothetical protein